MRVLRANSLAAVTNFVWSTRLNPASCASFRTTCRTATISCSVRIGSVSLLMTATVCLLAVTRFAQVFHAAIDIQRRLYTLQRQTQLDERNRNRRLHANNDCFGVEDTRHAGNIGDHAPHE